MVLLGEWLILRRRKCGTFESPGECWVSGLENWQDFTLALLFGDFQGCPEVR